LVFVSLPIYKQIHMRLRMRPLAQHMPACHLGTMDYSVATSARRQSPRGPLPLRLGADRTQAVSSSRLGPVGCRPVPVCGTTTKLITGRYRPVPGIGTGAGRSDPVDPVTRWDNLTASALFFTLQAPFRFGTNNWLGQEVALKSTWHTGPLFAMEMYKAECEIRHKLGQSCQCNIICKSKYGRVVRACVRAGLALPGSCRPAAAAQPSWWRVPCGEISSCD
jgi:hypothetical protein